MVNKENVFSRLVEVVVMVVVSITIAVMVAMELLIAIAMSMVYLQASYFQHIAANED